MIGDALTPRWLTHVLASAGVLDGATVTDVDLTPVGTGQLATSVRLRLRYDKPVPAPPTLVAKLPATDPTSLATAKTLRAYEVEVRFYQELAPDLPIRTPAVHCADIDVDSGRFVLLMEDLAPARQGDQLAGCSVAEAALAIGELVKLHAPRWGDPALAGYDWLHRDNERALLLEIAPPLWGGFCERYADRLGPEVHEAGSALFADFGRYLAGDEGPWTIVHRDFRLDNLLFGDRGGSVPIAVVDWQACTHASGLIDVAYFIGAGLLTDVRREHERDLVRRYHDGLVAAGVRDYGWEQCWTDHRLGSFAGFLTAVVAPMMVERTERGDDMFMAMVRRHARHVLDLDAPALLTS